MQRIELGLGCAMRAKVRIGPGKVLAVVDRKVHVVQGVMGGGVDEFLGPVAGDHVAVVDENGPDLDSHEEGEVEVTLDGEDEGEDAEPFVSPSPVIRE